MNLYKNLLSYLILLLLISACNPFKASVITSEPNKQVNKIIEEPVSPTNPPTEQDIIINAEQKATPPGRKILMTGRKMIADGLILPGGCWDYINEVYNRAGYPNRGKKRQTIFKGTKNRGPYANINLIQPGDFLYYINHSYNDIEHSAIFVDWLDFNHKEALMLSYGGESRRDPARYLPYELSNVYRITRAKD
ncbi:MAG: hypothetical protein KAH84_07375 [Thiomargarita sp.]|nr:hypothetical protein [Thiomargarita sp.]